MLVFKFIINTQKIKIVFDNGIALNMFMLILTEELKQWNYSRT